MIADNHQGKTISNMIQAGFRHVLWGTDRPLLCTYTQSSWMVLPYSLHVFKEHSSQYLAAELITITHTFNLAASASVSTHDMIHECGFGIYPDSVHRISNDMRCGDSISWFFGLVVWTKPNYTEVVYMLEPAFFSARSTSSKLSLGAGAEPGAVARN